MKCITLTLFCLLLYLLTFAQGNTLKVSWFYPKDAAKYEELTDLSYNRDSVYGKTTQIIHCESRQGHFEFVFTKKVRALTRIIDYKDGGVGEVFNFATNRWEHEAGTHEHKDMHSSPIDTTVYSDHNLYAFVLLQDHGGVIEKAKFQDFGNVVYWPSFEYPLCSISDEDKDGMPEFYLTYYGASDGLDAKELKQIIYTIPAAPTKGKSFIKSKATAYYAVDEETEQSYRVEYDSNWKQLPPAVQQKSQAILKKDKARRVP